MLLSGSIKIDEEEATSSLKGFYVEIAFAQQVQRVGVEEFHITALSHLIFDQVDILLFDLIIKKNPQDSVRQGKQGAFLFVEI